MAMHIEDCRLWRRAGVIVNMLWGSTSKSAVLETRMSAFVIVVDIPKR